MPQAQLDFPATMPTENSCLAEGDWFTKSNVHSSISVSPCRTKGMVGLYPMSYPAQTAAFLEHFGPESFPQDSADKANLKIQQLSPATDGAEQSR